MNHRTRYFLVGSALVVVVGLCTGLVAYYNGNFPGRSSVVGPVELSYLPADASAIGFANVQDIMTSEFRQRVREMLPTGAEKNRLLEETGIDIEHDIDRVVVGIAGPAGDRAGGVVLVRGRFDTGRIELLATQHGATVQDYRGRKLLVSPGPMHVTVPGPDGQFEAPAPAPVAEMAGRPAVAFLEGGLVAFGEVAALQRAIDASSTNNNITSNAELMNAMAEVEQTGDAWVVGRADAMTSGAQVPEHLRLQMAGIEWFSLSADVDTAVRGTLRAECADPQAAEQLRSVVNGALAAARMFAGRDPRVAGALNSLQSRGTDTSVELSFDITPEMLHLMHQMAPGGGPGPGTHAAPAAPAH